jgi:hypothetical protein
MEHAMPTKEQGQEQAELAKRVHKQRSSVIVGQLLQALGRPAILHRVDVRHLWDDHYRANVYVGADAASTRVAHSYFVVADEAGNIIASVPDITRKY